MPRDLPIGWDMITDGRGNRFDPYTGAIETPEEYFAKEDAKMPKTMTTEEFIMRGDRDKVSAFCAEKILGWKRDSSVDLIDWWRRPNGTLVKSVMDFDPCITPNAIQNIIDRMCECQVGPAYAKALYDLLQDDSDELYSDTYWKMLNASGRATILAASLAMDIEYDG